MKDMYQNYNFHTHTKRCGHAGIYEDKEYVYYARINGITRLGFTDHSPLPNIEFTDQELRMISSDVDDYIKSINSLKKENYDMQILVGFESEFDPSYEEYLRRLKSSVDYMILGQHFVKDEDKNTSDYPLIYARMVVKGLESGIFDFVAHPEIFMLEIDNLETEEEKSAFMENAVKASIMICETAREYGIPVELNVKYALRIGKKIRTFWEIASKENVKVVTGLDCHNPHLFSEFFKQKEDVINLLSGLNINFVNGNYNPVLSRLQNQKLDIIYKSREGKTLTSYSSYSLSLLNKIFDRIPKVSEAGVVENYILEEINNEINYIGTLHTKKNEIALDEVTHLTETDAYVRSFKLLRYKKTLESYSETIRVLTSTLNALKVYVSQSFMIGAVRKEDVIKISIDLMELNTSINPVTKKSIIEELDKYEESLSSFGKSSSSKLVKQNPLFDSGNVSEKDKFNWSSGFSNVVGLSLIISFIWGIATGIAITLLKL